MLTASSSSDSFPFEAFVSYAHSDRAFTDQLVQWLQRASLEVWLDHEQLTPGTPRIEASIAGSVKQCRHMLVVVSPGSLESEYTRWEVGAFREIFKGERRRIPILRMSRDEERLGPYLSDPLAIDWPENEPQPLARLWLVICGLRGLRPGPRAEWERRAKEEIGEVPRQPAASGERSSSIVILARSGLGQLALRCDRGPQWKALREQMALPQHQALFVVGERGQAHDVFLERIYQHLPDDPPRRIYPVNWWMPPASEEQCLIGLARALGCRADGLAVSLGARLGEQNVVLLHYPVFAQRLGENAAFAGYFGRTLPALLAQIGASAPPGSRRGHLKIVQAVAWSQVSRGRALLARAVHRLGVEGPLWLDRWLQRAEIEAALKNITSQRSALESLLLEPLADITPGHVETWLNEADPPLPASFDRKGLRAAVRLARDSEEILEEIARRLSALETSDDEYPQP